VSFKLVSQGAALELKSFDPCLFPVILIDGLQKQKYCSLRQQGAIILEKTIQPALTKNQIVICDRFVDSTRVYQGVARADLRQTVDELHSIIIKKEPDITFIIDTDPEKSLTRGLARNSGEDRFEEFGLEFQKKLRNGFSELSKTEKSRCHLINGMRSKEEVSNDILNIVKDYTK